MLKALPAAGRLRVPAWSTTRPVNGKTLTWKFYGTAAVGGGRIYLTQTPQGVITEGVETPRVDGAMTRQITVSTLVNGQTLFNSMTLDAYQQAILGSGSGNRDSVSL